jgi:hypothetical protein
MLNLKKRRILFAGFFLAIIFLIVGAGILLLRMQRLRSSRPPIAFLPSPAQRLTSINNQLFHTNQSGFFSYDVATGKTWQIAALNASTSVFNGQRVGGNTIGFEVGQEGSNATSSVYMQNVASGTLTLETDVGGDVGWYVDNLTFIAPDEFAYTEASATASMLDNYNRVFLFKNGTTTQIGFIPNPGEYGSTLSSAPDGKHLFFAGQIYNMAT